MAEQARDSLGRFLPNFDLGDKAVRANLSVSTRWYQKNVEGLAADVDQFTDGLRRLGMSRHIRVHVYKDGAPQAIRDLKAINTAIARGTRKHAKDVLRNSKKIVPVRTKRLKRSGRVHAARITRYDVTVTISYDTPYAIYVHEMLELKHAPPTMAKFLELPMRTGQRAFQAEVAKEVKKFVASRSI